MLEEAQEMKHPLTRLLFPRFPPGQLIPIRLLFAILLMCRILSLDARASDRSVAAPLVASRPVTYYAIPSPQSGLGQIIIGKRNDVWFTESAANKLGHIDDSGKVSEYPIPTLNANPYGIAVASDGAIWFTERTGNAIGRLSSAGSFSEYPLGTARSLPWGIEISRFGDVWFTEAGQGRIGQLIVSRRSIKEFSLSSKGAVPRMIAEALDGSHWFTEEAANKIGNITDDGVLRELPIPTQFSRPYGICTDSHGTVWFTEQALNPEPPARVAWGGNKIGRIDSASNISEYDVPTSRSVPWTITTGRFDRPWFVELTGGQLGEVKSAGDIQEFPLPRINNSDSSALPKSVTVRANGDVIRDDSSSVAPDGIAISHGGDIWFLETETNRVARIRSVDN